jgi:hypothetical protein
MEAFYIKFTNLKYSDIKARLKEFERLIRVTHGDYQGY